MALDRGCGDSNGVHHLRYTSRNIALVGGSRIRVSHQIVTMSTDIGTCPMAVNISCQLTANTPRYVTVLCDEVEYVTSDLHRHLGDAHPNLAADHSGTHGRLRRRTQSRLIECPPRRSGSFVPSRDPDGRACDSIGG